MATESERQEFTRLAGSATPPVNVIEVPKLSELLVPKMPWVAEPLREWDRRMEEWRKSILFAGTDRSAILNVIQGAAAGGGAVEAPGGGAAAEAFTRYHTLLDANYHTDTVLRPPVRGHLVVGNATPKWDALALGAAGKFLRSDGTDPSWQSITVTDITNGQPLTRVNDTNITLTLGGTPLTALLQAVSLTLGWTGVLSMDRGGSNKALVAVPGAVVWTDADSMELTAAGTAGQILVSGGAGSPVWQSAATATAHNLLSATHPDTLPASVVRGDIIRGNSTPKWERYANTDGEPRVLINDATDTYWGAVDLTRGTQVVNILSVLNGGTGVGSWTPYALVAGGALSTDPLQQVSGLGTSGQFLGSNGAGTLPTWKTITASNIGSAQALTRVDDTNVTLTLGGSPSTALLAATSLTLGWTGVLSLARGGTNKNITAVAGAVVWCDVDSFELTAAGTSGQILVSQGTSSPIWQDPGAATAHNVLSATHSDTLTASVVRGDLIVGNATPKWARLALGSSGKLLRSDGTDLLYSTFTIPNTFAQGDLLYANAANTLVALAKNATATRYLSNTGTSNDPAWAQVNLANGVTGTLPVGNGGTGVTALSDVLGTTNQVTVTNGTARVIGGNVTLSLPQNIHTGASPTFTGLTLSGIADKAIVYSDAGVLSGDATELWYDKNDNYTRLRLRAIDVSFLEPFIGTGDRVLYTNTITGAVTATGLYWDAGNSRCGVNVAAPGVALDVNLGFATRATSPAQITADQNNYPIGDGTFFRLSSDATRTITGLTGGSDGKHVIICNVGSNGIVLANQSASSTAANRIITGTGANISLAADERVELTYDSTTQRWRCGAKVYASGVAAHTLLSATHTDTVANAVTRGSLIYGNSTPAWDELVIGAANRVLRSNGTDVSWAQVALTTDVTGTLPIANGGTNSTSFTQGSVIFMGASALSENNAAFFWDNSAILLRIAGAYAATGDPSLLLRNTSTIALNNAATLAFSQKLVDATYVQCGRISSVCTDDGIGSETYDLHLYALTGSEVLMFACRPYNTQNYSYAHLVFSADNTWDIGAAGVTRPRDIYLAGSAIISTALYTQETSPAQITSDQNDYAIGAGTFFRLSTNASRTITGLTGGSNGKWLVICNVGSNNIVLANQSASSTAANRIITGTGANITIAPDEQVRVIYDDTTDRWRCGPKVFTGGGGSPHALLDGSTHSDTVAQGVTRGSLIYGNSTPAWDELVIGANNRVLRSNGTDVSWAQVALTTDVTGTLPVANGGTNATSFTAGSVLFAGSGGTSIAQDNSNFFWDDSNDRLGIRTSAAPACALHVISATASTDTCRVQGVASGGLVSYCVFNIYNSNGQRVLALDGGNSHPNDFGSQAFLGYQNSSSALTGDINFCDASSSTPSNADKRLALIRGYKEGTSAATGQGGFIFLTRNGGFLNTLYLHNSGRVWIGNPTQGTQPAGTLMVSAFSSSTIAQVIRGVSSQSSSLLEIQTSTPTTVVTVAARGDTTIAPVAASSGAVTNFLLTGSAHTAQTASTENIDVNFNLNRTVQHATGALTTQRAFVIQAPTYSFVGSSTLTSAATFAVTAAPTAGTNATITNAYGIWQQAGACRLDTQLFVNEAVTSGRTVGMTQPVATSGSPNGLVFTGGAHTTLAASTEATSINLNLAQTVQFATGALATQRAVRLQAPTYAFVASSTLTDAVTLEISGAPAAGTNATLTNSYALRVAAGIARFNGTVGVQVKPTALLHLAAGTTAANTGPLKIESGSLMTTAEVGAMEYNGNGYYYSKAKQSGALRVGIMGSIFDHYADAGNVGTGYDALYTDTISGGTFAANGDKLVAIYGVSLANTTSTKRVRLLFNSNIIFDSGILTISALSSMTITALLIRVSSGTIRYTVGASISGASAVGASWTGEVTGLTLTNDNSLVLQGDATGVGIGDNDIVGKLGGIFFAPAAA